MFRYNYDDIFLQDIKHKPFTKRAMRSVAVVDQYDSKDFNRNEAGFIRNDISSLARAQSQGEFQAILSRLELRDGGKSLPADMRPEDAISLIKSRYTQSPYELSRYAEQLAEIDVKKMDEAYGKALEDVRLETSGDSVSPVLDTQNLD